MTHQKRQRSNRVCIHTAAIIVTLSVAANPSSAAEPWTNLFDGKTTEGWSARGEVEMKVAGDEIQLTAQKNVWVVSDTELAEFVFEAEVKVPAEGEHVNSGIAFRCQGRDGKPKGYQCEVDASERAWSGGLHAIGKGWIHPQSGNAGSIAAFIKQSQGSFKRDDWNRFRIECRGDRIQIEVNGVLTTDVRDQTFAKGYFGIQHHGGGGVYRFRRLRVRPVTKDDADEKLPAVETAGAR